MSVLKIVKMGDPTLAIKSASVTDFNDNELKNHVSNMIDTMRHYQGVGLAAPQIGLAKRIVVLEVAHNKRYPQAGTIELDILINPKILSLSEQTDSDWEGCLSLPGMRGLVTRSNSIDYEAYNMKGELLQMTVHGFHARIIQHEVDHLNGILYPQRLDDLQSFGFEDSLPAFTN